MILSLDGVDSFYGRAQILHGVGFAAAAGEALVLLGRNGAGKSTALKTIMGLLRPAAGRILFAGVPIGGLPPHRIARLGVGYVAEDRRIFPDLTVAENFEVGRKRPASGDQPLWTPERLYGLFPNLERMADRPGGRMSGGEQQMLAVARTLMGNPRLLLLDEPGEGLAPVIVDCLADALLTLKRAGVSMLIAEQNLALSRRIADRAVLLETGRVAWTGPVAELAEDAGLRRRYLGV